MAKRNKIPTFGGKNQLLMPKRIHFGTTEKITKEKTSWVEIDTDYTQVYDCFSKISVKLKSITSVKLLFWLLSHEANKSNGISSGKAVYERFMKYLKEEGADSVTGRTFQNCFEELTSIRALTRIGKGAYYLNPYIFWRDEIKERVNFITDEAKENKYLSLNPIEEKQKT